MAQKATIIGGYPLLQYAPLFKFMSNNRVCFESGIDSS